MMHPRIDDLLASAGGSRYALVIAAAKRARQINNYHHQLGEGTFDDFAPPLVESRSKNYLTRARSPSRTPSAGLEGQRWLAFS
jgi:DNA-directed RNA polymerase subunit omega